MKVNQSVFQLYQRLKPLYDNVGKIVDETIKGNLHKGWFYISRVKSLESFCTKLELGRIHNPSSPEDFFAATIVVENKRSINAASELIEREFNVMYRRPEFDKLTNLRPSVFDFDDLRLFCTIKIPEHQEDRTLEGMIFEIQIKTFLQHAWGIATHDLIYKGATVEWLENRVAYQVKAMLEQAEMAIIGVEKNKIPEYDREDESTKRKKVAIQILISRFDKDKLPMDIKRLSESIIHLTECLRVDLEELGALLDHETGLGRGTAILDMSPYSIVFECLWKHKKGAFEHFFSSKNRKQLFVPNEIETGTLSIQAEEKLIRI